MFMLLVLLTVPGSARAAPSRSVPIKILVTDFEPFQGPTNSSQAVSASLTKFNSPDASVIYEVCTLPVEYDQSFARARTCYENSAPPKPAAVLALGESTDKLKIETKAKNWDDDLFADNAGVQRQGQPIDRGAPPEESFTLPIEEMLCASGQFGAARVAKVVTPSVSMQNYVCNNLAFRLSRFLKPLGVPFGFMHVPDQRHFHYAESPAEVADRIHRMVSETIARAPNRSVEPCLKSGVRKTALGTMDAVGRGCRESVRRRIRELTKAASGEPSEESY